jgi:hypothetical protein
MGASGVIAAIVISLFLRQSRHPAARVDSSNAKAIAVLPFQNAGSDKDTDFLRLALSDEIATTLSYVPSFSIRPLLQPVSTTCRIWTCNRLVGRWE